MSQRFNYVKYDEKSMRAQETLKEKFEAIEIMLEALPNTREKALCLSSLEVAYMWTGKAIRNLQMEREADPIIHMPERGNV